MGIYIHFIDFLFVIPSEIWTIVFFDVGFRGIMNKLCSYNHVIVTYSKCIIFAYYYGGPLFNIFFLNVAAFLNCWGIYLMYICYTGLFYNNWDRWALMLATRNLVAALAFYLILFRTRFFFFAYLILVIIFIILIYFWVIIILITVSGIVQAILPSLIIEIVLLILI